MPISATGYGVNLEAITLLPPIIDSNAPIRGSVSSSDPYPEINER